MLVFKMLIILGIAGGILSGDATFEGMVILGALYALASYLRPGWGMSHTGCQWFS